MELGTLVVFFLSTQYSIRELLFLFLFDFGVATVVPRTASSPVEDLTTTTTTNRRRSCLSAGYPWSSAFRQGWKKPGLLKKTSPVVFFGFFVVVFLFFLGFYIFAQKREFLGFFSLKGQCHEIFCFWFFS